MEEMRVQSRNSQHKCSITGEAFCYKLESENSQRHMAESRTKRKSRLNIARPREAGENHGDRNVVRDREESRKREDKVKRDKVRK